MARPPAPDANDLELLACLRDSPVGLGLFDPDERLRHANPTFLTAFDAALDGAPTWEALMRHCHGRRRGLKIDAEDIEVWLAHVRRYYRKRPTRSFESDLTDGRWMWVTETLRPDGWVLVVMTDVTPLKANEATLRSSRDKAVLASLTDPLTGLYNRRYVFDRLADLVDSTRGMRIPLTVAVLDLDRFKLVNDRHGHGTGDAVLQHFAERLKRHRRPLDIAGRIGGEEFLVVLPNAGTDGAQQALRRLRELIGAGLERDGAEPLPYSFSAGVATARLGETVEQCMNRADRALYRAKDSGRDCIASDDEAGSAA